MPIKISNNLPAVKTLESENIFVITANRAISQDIRPLKILILNLMPTKIVTETQLLRCLSNTPLQIEVDLLKTSTYSSKNTSDEHLVSFYKTFDEIKENKYDGLIVTGAPVEKLNYNDVLYIDELKSILDWAEQNVYSSLYICWGALVALNHFYNIPKYNLDTKISGVFEHYLTSKYENIFRGFDDIFNMPHSRHSEIKLADIIANDELDILANSEIAGPSIITTKNRRKFFITGHLEYDSNTLSLEYFRDKTANFDTSIPKNYFLYNDPTKKPIVTWRSHSQLFFSNWLNYVVYQETPYDLNSL